MKCRILLALALITPTRVAADEFRRLDITPGRCELAGLRDGRQLIVTGVADGGRSVDLTRKAKFTVAPPERRARLGRGIRAARGEG